MWGDATKLSRGLAALALAAACDPNSNSEAGDGDGDGDDTQGDATTQGAPATGTTTGDNPADVSGSPTTGGPSCELAESTVLWAADAALVAPMELTFVEDLNIQVARSWQAEQGTITMPFDLLCGGPIYLWGLVWDSDVAGAADNADSFFLRMDTGDEIVWDYGCDVPVAEGGAWNWVPIDTSNGVDCRPQPLELDLSDGGHTLVLRNREPGSGPNVAALGAIVYSHDPEIDPAFFFTIPEIPPR